MTDTKPKADILTALRQDVMSLNIKSPGISPAMLESLRGSSRAVGRKPPEPAPPSADDDAAEEPEVATPPPPPPHEPRRRVGRPRATEQVEAPAPPPPPPPAVHVAPDEAPDDPEPQETDDDMTKRRRAKHAMPAAQNVGKLPTSHGVPLTQIQEAVEKYQTVACRIYRRNARGHLAVLTSVEKTPAELADIDMWIKEMWGGGRFRVEARNPDAPTEYAHPIPPFEFDVDGPMKAPNLNTSPEAAGFNPAPPMAPMFPGMPGTPSPVPAGYGLLPGMQPGPRVDPRILPPFVRGMTPEQQVQYAQQMGIPVMQPDHMGAYTQPVMKFTPDELAKGEAERATAALAEERRQRELERRANELKLEQLRKESDAKLEAFNKRFEQLDRERAEERARERDRLHEMQMAGLRAEMQQLAQQSSQPRKPVLDPALVTAAAPILTALLTGQREAQSKAIELQSQGVQSLMKATLEQSQKNPLFDLIKNLAPLIAPLAPFLKDWWESKSPRAQADLVATLAENQLTSIGMMAKLVNEFASASGGGSEPPWWLPVVQETMRGVTQAAEKLTQTSKDAVQPQVVAGPPAHAQNAAPPPSPMAAALNAMSGAQIAQLIFSDARFPQDFKTREWMHILTIVHDKKPAHEVAKIIANHIRDLDLNLPQTLKGLWDTDEPEKILGQLFGALPIAQMDAQYTSMLVTRIVDTLTTEEEKPAVVTPAPAQPADNSVPFNMGAFPFQGTAAPAQKVG